MKRLIALCLVLVLTLPLLVVPASAATTVAVDDDYYSFWLEAIYDKLVSLYYDVTGSLSEITDFWILQMDYNKVLGDLLATIGTACNALLKSFNEYKDTLLSTLINHVYGMEALIHNVLVDTYNTLVQIADFLLETFQSWFYDLCTDVTYISQQMFNFYKTAVSFFSDALSALKKLVEGDKDSSQDFEDKVDELDKEGQDYLDKMDGLERPPASDIDFDIPELQGNFAALLLPLRNMLSTPLFLQVLVMSFTFATASYILFGKR